MSVEYKNDDFVLKFEDQSEKVWKVVDRYEAYLHAFTTSDFGHVRDAIRQSVAFFVSDQNPTTKDLADSTYRMSRPLQRRYATKGEYLNNLRIPDRKSVTVDLATGTGKSWVIFGVAQIRAVQWRRHINPHSRRVRGTVPESGHQERECPHP